MTLLINRVLFSFEMKKYASLAEMDMILQTTVLQKHQEEYRPSRETKASFQDLWGHWQNPGFMNL